MQNCKSYNKSDNVQECINILVQNGANANSQDPQQDGKTVLMIACEKGYLEIIDCLLDQEDCQINYKDSKMRTPMLHALESAAENEDIILHLIRKGADVNLSSFEGWSPLLKATQKQFHVIMGYLLQHEANTNQKVGLT